MLKIEKVKPTDLVAYGGNAKLHPAEQIEQIKNSIEQFGFNDPIAVWRGNEVVEGHGRLIAALELGMDKVPIIRLDGLTDEQRRAYAIVHNKLTMDTGFDFDLLMAELSNMDIDLTGYGFDSDLGGEMSFSNTEFDTEEFADDKFEYECPDCGFRFNA